MDGPVVTSGSNERRKSSNVSRPKAEKKVRKIKKNETLYDGFHNKLFQDDCNLNMKIE